MKYICPRCKQISVNGNQWCQERFCPAENAIEIFDNGEFFGSIEIVELLGVCGTAAFYRARRAEQPVLLKIANPGGEERLKREAAAFLEITRSMSHPALPMLLPAHEQGTVKDFPFGWTVVNGKTRYYEVFESVEGDLLGNLLLKTPQPWFQHAGWMMISLADVLVLLHRHQKLHLCLHPDILLVRFDRQQIPRLTLLDLGVADIPQNVPQAWKPAFCPPAYTAPELVEMDEKIGTATDVYGLGLLLYEMLAGRPAFEYRLMKNEEVYASVRRAQFAPTGRRDLKNIPELAESAINHNYAARPQDVIQFAARLQANFPPMPREKKPFRINWRSVTIVIGAALAISLILILAVVGAPQ